MIVFLLIVPVVKRRKHAEEEDETYEHEISGSEEEYNPEEEILEEEEEEEDNDFETDSPSDVEEELPSTSKTLKDLAIDSKKRGVIKRKLAPEKQEKKRVLVRKTKTPPEKRVVRKVVKKNVPRVETVKEKTLEEGKKQPTATVSTVEYNDKNVDYNLYNEAPENIRNVKIKISSNVVMLCRMIEASGNSSQGLTYDYAALSFVRQSKNGKAYEYNIALNCAPLIMKGISLIMKQNPKFFDKNFQSTPADEID